MCVHLRVFRGTGFNSINPTAQREPRLPQLRCAAQRLGVAVKPGPGHVVDAEDVARGMVGLCAEGAGLALGSVVVEVVGHRWLWLRDTGSVIVVRLRG